MYKELANRITNTLIKKSIICKDQRDLCLYGFEILISSLFYFIVFLLCSVLSKTIFPSFIFWLGLFIFRKIAGGHHSKTYTACHILFALNHIAFIIFVKFIKAELYSSIIYTIFTIAIISLVFIAPVDHKNKPFIGAEYIRFRYLSIIYCLAITLILGLLIIKIIPPSIYVFSYSIGTLSASISLLIGKITRKKETKKEELNYEKTIS